MTAVILKMFAYNEGFYKTRRIHKRLVYLSPPQRLEC